MAVLTGLVLAAFIAVVVAITGKSAGEMLVGYPTVFTLVWGAGGSVLLSIQRRAGG